jgi:hypothetical protein
VAKGENSSTGWCKVSKNSKFLQDINYLDAEQTVRYKRKIEKDENYLSQMISLMKPIEKTIFQVRITSKRRHNMLVCNLLVHRTTPSTFTNPTLTTWSQLLWPNAVVRAR